MDWHHLADGGRDDIFDLGTALAEEYGLAARVWLERGRQLALQRGLPVVDHAFLDSFSLDVETKSSRYLQLLQQLPPASASGPCTRAWLTVRLAKSTTDGKSAVLILNS